ncbi:MAG: J domain-containing protein [Oscillospiraceae bacterium]
MNDPYKVLGVLPSATDDEVKTAYRNLARKYHPDHYVDNPLSDLAQEKMKEINEAYDTVQKMRKNKGEQNSYGGGYSGSSYSGSSQFSDVRRLILQKRISEAEELLKGVPQGSRNAEWFFLMGSIHYNRGWLEEAFNSFSRAASMEPNNPEYREAVNKMMFQRNNASTYGQGNYRPASAGGCSGCDLCSGLVCADCCCECFGGDLISCC